MPLQHSLRLHESKRKTHIISSHGKIFFDHQFLTTAETIPMSLAGEICTRLSGTAVI